jgi:hypothetical protein
MVVALAIALFLSVIPRESTESPGPGGSLVIGSGPPSDFLDSSLTYHDLVLASESEAGVVDFASKLLEVQKRVMSTESFPSALPGEPVAMAVLQPQTPNEMTYTRIGWPYNAVRIQCTSASKPVKNPSAKGIPWNLEIVPYGFFVTVNWRAWPGTGVLLAVDWLPLLFIIILAAAMHSIVSVVLRAMLRRRARRRISVGRCGPCGYDLKGLRPTAST